MQFTIVLNLIFSLIFNDLILLVIVSGGLMVITVLFLVIRLSHLVPVLSHNTLVSQRMMNSIRQ
jgi:hypothetical protein